MFANRPNRCIRRVLLTPEIKEFTLKKRGKQQADEETRTPDPRITNLPLGAPERPVYCRKMPVLSVKWRFSLLLRAVL